jgi:peptidoglycan/LPS O-acetylase OafA/YrhL
MSALMGPCLKPPTNHAHPDIVYRKDIDGVRALAVLSVVLFHAFPGYLPGGFIGVDVFFVISGYLISSIITAELDRGKFSFLDFYARRVRRIFPALLLVLVSTGVVGLAVLFPDEVQQLFKHELGGTLFLSNLVLMRESGYFDHEAITKPLLHFWSLAIEEQFYLFWPFLLWLTHRLRWPRWGLILTVGLASFAANIWWTEQDSVVAFYSITTRGWELLVGAWLAIVRPLRAAPHLRDHSAWRSMGGVGALLFALSLLLESGQGFPGWRALLPVSAAALMLAAPEHAFWNRRVLSHPILRWIGLISYPLYLWHWPLLSFAHVLSGDEPTLLVRTLSVLLSVLLAALTYRWIERPVRHATGQATWLARPTVWLSLLMIVWACFAGYQTLANTRWTQSSHPPDTSAFETSKACQDKLGIKDSGFCVMHAPELTEKIFLLGDSHADNLYQGLAEPLRQRGINLIKVGGGNCTPLLGIDTVTATALKGCDEFITPVLQMAVQDTSVRTVILSSYSISVVTGGFHYRSGKELRLLDKESVDAQADSLAIYLRGLDRTLSTLEAAGKRVVLVLDTPELDFHPRQCEPRRLSLSERQNCFVSREKVRARLGELQGRIQQLASKRQHVRIVNPQNVLCDDTRCDARRNDHYLYQDRDHLSAHGSEVMGQYLLPQLLD